ncbi:hypothetical protein RRG08_037925 [Elysia crispata]|uniref:Exonuclease domain-containing protein n=1 Tax=Elysia crispata TaxID=231223 RepID=A0AAE0Z402_9GAST|nr:hypothetical protein RRG08_037925 [Elysia crispata]
MALSSDTPPQTFVFYDTEGTGLPMEGDLPKFTELSFLAVSRKELTERDKSPRILNKLTLTFNPKKQLTSSAKTLSGLTNELLESSATFSEQVPMVISFLKGLPQPVCLVAHSGNKFDFPLLVRHLEDAGRSVQDLPSVVCADSFPAFKALHPMRSYKLGNIYKQVCGGHLQGLHSAENDCKMLKDIVHTMGSDTLIRWFSVKAKPLSFFKCPPEDFCSRFTGYI